jgi:lysophospholipase L1-like esterase
MNAWRISRPPLAATGVFVGQMLRAAYRDDLPSYGNQDPSGSFGDPSLPKLRIVFLGDSSVTAPGVDPLDHCWARQIAIHLGDRFHVEARSVALGGSRVRDVLGSQVDRALAIDPDIAYVSVGSNDALRGTPIGRFEAEYSKVVERLDRRVSAIGLSWIGDLGTIPRLPELARGIARIRARAVNNAVARVAARYPSTVKSNAWGVMEGRFANEPDLFAGDLFHASAAGHLVFAEVALPVADRLVEIWQRDRT